MLSGYIAAELARAQEKVCDANDVVDVRRAQGECRALKKVAKDLVADVKPAP